MPDRTNDNMMTSGASSDIPTAALPMLLVLALVAVMDVGLDLAWVATGALDVSRYLFGQVALWWAAWLALFPVMVALVLWTRPAEFGWPAVVAGHVVLGVPVALAQSWLAGFLFVGLDMSVETAVTPVFLTLAERFGVASYAIYLAAVGASLAYRHFLRARTARVVALEAEQAAAALEATVASAELDELSAGLPPRFVSGAFDGVAALIQSGKSDDAVRMIAALGDLLRASMPGDGRPVSLRTELEDVRRYVDIELRRFGANSETRLRIAPELDGTTVQRLALRPFAEQLTRTLAAEGSANAGLVIEATTEAGVVEVRAVVQSSATPAITYTLPGVDGEIPPETR